MSQNKEVKLLKLSIKQRAFADYYIELGNKSEAARKAGYSPKYINANVTKLLQNTAIKAYIDERLKQLEDERIASAGEVLKYLTAVMRNEHTEEIVVVEGCGEGCSEARTVNKELAAKDRLKAAELLGKRYGIFTENINLSKPPTIVDDVPDE